MDNALPAILDLRQDLVTPQNIGARQAMADAVISVAAKLQDWPLLDEAIRIKIADQRKFIEEHWNPIVGAEHGGDRSKVASGATLTVRGRFEIESGIGRHQVKRWNGGLRDEAAYRDEIARAARVAAGLEESERAKRDAEAQRRREEARKRAVPATGERYRLIEASVTALMDEPAGSIDFVVTDPPYEAEALPLFGELARGAAHVLRPGGLLICMSGQLWLPRVYTELSGTELNYLWTLSYLTPNENVQIFSRRAHAAWKPIIMYCQGEYQGEWYGDVVHPEANDKEHHDWGQAVSGFRELMERFVLPGHSVCDPFLGGGTTAVVALEMGASFLGFDVDPEALLTTQARIADAITPSATPP